MFTMQTPLTVADIVHERGLITSCYTFDSREAQYFLLSLLIVNVCVVSTRYMALQWSFILYICQSSL